MLHIGSAVHRPLAVPKGLTHPSHTMPPALHNCSSMHSKCYQRFRPRIVHSSLNLPEAVYDPCLLGQLDGRLGAHKHGKVLSISGQHSQSMEPSHRCSIGDSALPLVGALHTMSSLDPCIYTTEKRSYFRETSQPKMLCGSSSRFLIGACAVHDDLLFTGITL